MLRFLRFALGRTLPILCAVVLSTPLPTQAAQPPALHWSEAQNLPQLVASLEHWLDRNSDYPSRKAPPQIRMISLHDAYAVSGQAAKEGVRPRGFYDTETATLYLVRPWSPRDVQDVSVLLHELAHHRQATAKHWYCPGAMELPAYQLQEAFLNAHGETGQINWVAAALEGSCHPKDFHPD